MRCVFGIRLHFLPDVKKVSDANLECAGDLLADVECKEKGLAAYYKTMRSEKLAAPVQS